MEEMLARMWEGLVARVGGPMTFRLILQPLMATLLAVLGGLKDAREGRPAYFGQFLQIRVVEEIYCTKGGARSDASSSSR